MKTFDYKKLKIDGAFLVSGQITQAFFAFAVNLVLVRFIPPNDFGRFALILAGVYIFYSIISPRINILLISLPESDYNEKNKETLFSAMTLETLVATVIISLWLIISGNHGFWEFALVGAVGLRHWTDLNKAFFERNMHYRQLAIVETGASAGGHLLALALVFGGFGWVILFIREIVNSFINLIGLWRVGGLSLFNLRLLTMAEWLSLYKNTRGVWLDGVMEGNFHRFTILIAGFLGGEVTAGLFFQAQRLASVPNQFLSPIIHRIMLNWFGRIEDPTTRKAGRDKVLKLIFLPLLIAAIFTALFADPIVIWLFGESWARVAVILVAMSGMICFWTLYETLKIYCMVTRQSITMFSSRVVQLAGLLIPTSVGYWGWLSNDIALGVGLSVAYFLAFIYVYAILLLSENRLTNHRT